MRFFMFYCLAIGLSQLQVPLASASFGDELLRVADPEGGFRFGSSVNINGNTFIVGTGGYFDSQGLEPCSKQFPVNPEDVISREEVYVHDYARGSQPIHVLRGDTPNEANWFGGSVAVDGNLAIVGAPFEDADGLLDSGAAYLFDVTTGQQLFKFVPDDALDFDRHGSAVAIHGNRAVVASDCARVAYLYDTTSGQLVKTLRGFNNAFGASVAISENTVIVGGTSGGGGLGAAASSHSTQRRAIRYGNTRVT